MTLLNGLLLMYRRSNVIENDCLQSGDYTDNARIASFLSLVSNAIQVEEAHEIEAVLPNDETLADVPRRPRAMHERRCSHWASASEACAMHARRSRTNTPRRSP